jgi:hypothetical protein
LRPSSAWRRIWGAVYNVSPLTRSSAAFDHCPSPSTIRYWQAALYAYVAALEDLDTAALLAKSL